MSRIQLRPGLRAYAHAPAAAPAAGFVNTYSIAFDGNDDYADTPTLTLAEVGTALSASLWFYVDVTRNGETFFWLGRTGSSAFNRLKFHLYHAWTTLQMRQGDGMSNQSGWLNAPTALTTGWHHFVFSDTATNAATGVCKMYLDDTLEYTYSPSYQYAAAYDWARSNVTVGRWGYGLYGTALLGNIDEVTLWDRALSEAEVTELFGGSGVGVPIDPTTLSAGGPIHWWRMGDEVSGTTVPDQVGSLDMTLGNGATTDTDVPT